MARSTGGEFLLSLTWFKYPERERERYWVVGVNWNNVSLLAVGFESFLLADSGDVTPVRGGRGEFDRGVCIVCVSERETSCRGCPPGVARRQTLSTGDLE